MLTNKEIWGWGVSQRVDNSEAIRRAFLSNVTCEAVTLESKLVVTDTTYNIAVLVTSLLDSFTPISSNPIDYYYISGMYKGSPMLVMVMRRESFNDDDDDRPTVASVSISNVGSIASKGSIVSVYVTAPHDLGKSLLEEVSNRVIKITSSVIRWWYKPSQHGGFTIREVFLDPPKTTLHPFIYPTIDCDPKQYLEDYIKSEQSILFLSGEPGTGKTSLLRHLIYDFNLCADITYDDDAIKSDYVFQNWLFDSRSSLMIVEDADSILKPREDDNNPLMARFLNVAEGLIKLPNKKLIFTSNLLDNNDVDEALIRPGRCYGTIQTRPYIFEEAVKVCKLMDWIIPEDKTSNYTIAELANGRRNAEKRKVGF